MDRVEVLNRVGGLLLLPNTELATTRQVAEFFGVGYQVVNKLLHRNREELEANGMKVIPRREIKELVIKELVYEDSMSLYKISKRGETFFNKRTILLVGFMLRDSKIVQEFRNQVLNVIENSTDEVKTMEITQVHD